MAKTNFTKAEEALSEALQKMMRTKLLEAADAAQGISQQATDEEKRERIALVQSLKRGIKRLYHNDKEIYTKLAIKKKDLDMLLTNAETLTKENWENVVVVKHKVTELVKLLPEEQISNEDLVKQQRKHHKTKRFNVNDKWLPLT